MRFSPVSVYLGAALTLVGVLGTLAIALWDRPAGRPERYIFGA
jgi:hypothetical protein